MPPDALPQEDRAQIAWATPTRGDRTFIEILGEQVTVLLKGSVVRVILKQEGLSRIVTDFVESVEIRALTRNRAPPMNRGRPSVRSGRRAMNRGAGRI